MFNKTDVSRYVHTSASNIRIIDDSSPAKVLITPYHFVARARYLHAIGSGYGLSEEQKRSLVDDDPDRALGSDVRKTIVCKGCHQLFQMHQEVIQDLYKWTAHKLKCSGLQ